MAPAFRPWAVLLAAGSGSRMAAATGNIPKQFLQHHDAPLYWRSALALAACPPLAGMIFVFPRNCLAAEEARVAQLAAMHGLGLPWKAVAGGERRQDSVRHGLGALPPTCSHVLVHDAARPFVDAALLQRLCTALQQGARGVIPVIPVTDTVKHIADGYVLKTLPRDELAAVQTPQGFLLADLHAAHERCLVEDWQVTDDASLLEACGIPVSVVPGAPGNCKITTPEDLTMLAPASAPPLPCSGLGYDVHRFGAGRPLRLGGVLIPNAPEVIAHSDGDVLLHALMDALLGAAALGDIGQHFPDVAAEFENISSATLLARVLDMLAAAHVRVVHVDVTIIAQIPKISPHRDSIRRNLARLLGLDLACVNVKATTEEGLGFTGAREGIKALAQVSALRPASSPAYGA